MLCLNYYFELRFKWLKGGAGKAVIHFLVLVHITASDLLDLDLALDKLEVEDDVIAR
jgi:hypothetical protein